MDALKSCRTCLAKPAPKFISELKHKGSTCSDIMLFCLDIKVLDNKDEITKLCVKCYKKILEFYEFKLEAQKNDAILNNCDVKPKVEHEIRVSHTAEDEEISNEELHSECFLNETTIKTEYITDDRQSDDQLLSDVNNIEYQFVPDDDINKTKENEPIKHEKLKKRKLYKKKRKTCKECGKSVTNLKQHIKIHDQTFPCKLCDDTFPTVSDRRRHVKSKHIPFKKKCTICNKEVLNMLSHTLIMHETAQMRYACESCGRKFQNESALARHATVHTRDRPFTCDYCGQKFRQKMPLSLHIRDLHLREKLHMCQYCSKSFNRKYTLELHIRVHTKEKAWKCDHCGKHYSRLESLKFHQLLHTNTGRVFMCTLCDKKFTTVSYRNKHMRTHKATTKYLCKYCGLEFTRPFNRNRHEYSAHEKHLNVDRDMRTHTATTKYPCNYCGLEFTRSFNRTRHEQLAHEEHFKIDR